MGEQLCSHLGAAGVCWIPRREMRTANPLMRGGKRIISPSNRESQTFEGDMVRLADPACDIGLKCVQLPEQIFEGTAAMANLDS